MPGIELTTLSELEYNRLSSQEMTPAMAAEYLWSGRIVLRTFRDTLRAFYPYPDLLSRLTAAFQADAREGRPDSIAKNVRNWVSGRIQPASREDLFHIAFALSLSEQQASYLLGLCTDYAIHYRDGRETVYAWFLRTGRSYGEARDFFESLPGAPRLDSVPDNAGAHLTRDMQNEFLRLQTLDDLRECYMRSLDNFGALHLRAYTYFSKYLKQLIQPASTAGVPEPDYSMEAVMSQYLSLKMPSGKDRGGYSAVQKLIKRNWPNTTALKNIRLRKEDVPRKLLLLLYVITENVVDGEYRELDEDYISPRERLDDHWYCLNAILADCGMPLLDPRNATDWLVLYAITAEGHDQAMSERMEQVIEALYADVR
ncbi:MAG: hypothetical protein NC319_09455 [Butyricicoccus sp.]|nr:hypothetical protein [Butyricicoccus sp.]